MRNWNKIPSWYSQHLPRIYNTYEELKQGSKKDFAKTTFAIYNTYEELKQKNKVTLKDFQIDL